MELGQWNKTTFGNIDTDIVAFQGEIDRLELKFEQTDLSAAEKRAGMVLSELVEIKTEEVEVSRQIRLQLDALSLQPRACDGWRWSVGASREFTVKSSSMPAIQKLSIFCGRRCMMACPMYGNGGAFASTLSGSALSVAAPGAQRSQEVWMLLGSSMLWSVWLARNALLFESKPLYQDMLFDLVLTRAFWWFKGSHLTLPASCYPHQNRSKGGLGGKYAYNMSS
ncbi:hypothetical protein Tsubulata_006123 [Turnera subulata]|uniref:Uncharacterized protein n=1 Tax=Turnera subulata TaxID=218843 RepID=A0A9Q0F8N9_9ROSI|nr:hypothetical protein Tsubulata_006123 [Turnera subulata]